MGEVHGDKGYDHDKKYSYWRREVFPEKAGTRSAYCTDIDWIEWRNGKPVAILECRRAMRGLKTAQAAVNHIKTCNNGFQFEVIARMAYQLEIPAYLVGIEDPDLEGSKEYARGKFRVEEVVPPNEWPAGRLDIGALETKLVGEMDEATYVRFLADLCC